MAWLILYSQTEKGREISANTVVREHPADWLVRINKRYPDITNKLLFAIEISEKQFEMLDGEL